MFFYCTNNIIFYCYIFIKIFTNGELEDYEEIKNSISKVEYDLRNRYIPVNEYGFEIIDLKKFYQDDSIYSTLLSKFKYLLYFKIYI